MKTANSILVILALSLMIGCTTLTPQQSNEYNMMERDGVLIEEKNPTTGALLGMLPGGGAFYGREPIVGAVDLLAWPLSILWDPIVGHQMSKTVNYNLTVSSLRKAKQKELNELENQKDLEKISKVDYVNKKREIDQKYNYEV
jgi:hypothetical protein